MKAIVLSIGDELILGQTVDTNSAWLAQQLASIGLPCAAHVTLPDDRKAIADAIEESVGRCDFLLITGGIGPTEDDLTRFALADVLRQPLEQNEAAMATLAEFFAKINRPMAESNRIQAMIPRTATAIPNPNGTAAGIDAPYRSADQKTLCRIFVMPGVPKEMKGMFLEHILPVMKDAAGGGVILSRTLHTFGLGESVVAEKLGRLMDRSRNPSVGTTVSQGIVSLRLNARFNNKDEAARQIHATEKECRNALGDVIFGADDDTLPLVVSRLLTTRNLTVTTAESCTGGLLAKMLTDISGSSTFFKQGWVTYSNEAKRERLGVSENIINTNGAVSEPTVAAMATNARRLARSDFALAISGVAGPTGGTPAKPVGTVCIGFAYESPAVPGEPARPRAERFAQSTTLTRTFIFPGDREMIRDRSAKMALTVLRYHLLQIPLPF